MDAIINIAVIRAEEPADRIPQGEVTFHEAFATSLMQEK
jgi:hypothetical protein